MICVGIDVSKRKSTVAIINLLGEVLYKPFDVEHTKIGLNELFELLKPYAKDDVRVVMEATGIYHLGILNAFIEEEYFVHVANPLVIKKFFDAEIRKGKTDRKDALKLSQYGSEKWFRLESYSKVDTTYAELQMLSREYNQLISQRTKSKVQLSNLIERTFPGLEKVLTTNYFELLLDFLVVYPHASSVLAKGEKKFRKGFEKMAKEKGHRKGPELALKVYQVALNCVPCCANSTSIQISVESCINVLKATVASTEAIITQMTLLAKELPEYEVVRAMAGVGDKLAPRLIAEIGDIRRFDNHKSLIAFSGIDAPPYQSGQFEGTNRHISKRGSRSIRKCGYEVMRMLKIVKPTEDSAVYDYIIKKELEGKNKKVAKIAGLNKFLRIYYARVKEVYKNQD